jgi:hypothetical protein
VAVPVGDAVAVALALAVGVPVGDAVAVALRVTVGVALALSVAEGVAVAGRWYVTTNRGRFTRPSLLAKLRS